MANIAHSGSSRPAAPRLDAVQLVGGFVAVVAVGGQVG